MAQLINQLNELKIKKLNHQGYYNDGLGLYLRISSTGSKSWVLRYRLNGHSREMGLGSSSFFNVNQARERARAAQRQITDCIDPIDARKNAHAHSQRKSDPDRYFMNCAVAFIEVKQQEWRNPKHRTQWINTLQQYAFPIIGKIDVNDITTQHLIKLLQPIWLIKNETATRIRGRIEKVLDWAGALGLRSGENPARWTGHLENLLPAPTKVQTVIHFPSMPYSDVPALFTNLPDYAGMASQALQLLILCASRTGEVLGARWHEFDFEKNIWTIDGTRMKSGRTHRIPLNTEAVSLLGKLKKLRHGSQNDFVFHQQSLPTKPLSQMAMSMLMRRLGLAHFTVHGFRSSFRTWAGEQTTTPREIVEAALAHVNANKVEAAYLRSDYFDRRRELMQKWEVHLTNVCQKNTVPALTV